MELGNGRAACRAARTPDLLQGKGSGTAVFGMGTRAGLMAAALAPFALAWVGWNVIRSGRYDTPAALLLFAAATTLLLVLTIGWLIRQLHRMDRRRNDAAATRMRDLLESTPDAMVVVNGAGSIVHANSQACALFGYAPGELPGQAVELLLPERSRDAHISHRSAYALSPRTRAMGAGLELHGLRKDRTEFPVEISLSPIEDEDGIAVISAIRDITARKRHEQMLMEKNAELASASQAKDRFLANMSHELRTPLNAVIGFTGTLLMRLPGPLNDEQEKQLKTVQSSARHLLSLINDLLDVAKIEAGKVTLQPEPTDCRELLADVAGTLAPQAQLKGLQFDLNVPEESVMLRADRRALRQIVLNLANNAIKFTDRGAVTLSLIRHRTDAGPMVSITIRDTGIGIRPEDQARLFAAFAQADSGDRGMREGTGLGLHLSRKLAELMGGTLTLESALGQGSTFTVNLREDRK